MLVHIEIYLDGVWQRAASFESMGEEAAGHTGKASLCYEPLYVANNQGRREAALSALFPVSFEWDMERERWPAFMLDILPTGAARRTWLNRLEETLPSDQRADWALLRIGGGNPVGNLRIAEAAAYHKEMNSREHPGFAYAEIIARGEAFIEYARQHGAPVSGSTGAQGDAPKFLLIEDHDGRWHADNAIPDVRIKRHWLVKFPRGKRRSDRVILETEAAYHRVAQEIGIDTGEAVRFERDALFIPRFDRVVFNDTVIRLGMETLCSIADIRTYGREVSQNRLAKAIVEQSDDPQADIVEFIQRDMLNLVLGNTDNHGRNTALLKRDGQVRLAPLYDFAPMYLDDAGIPRCCRWDNEHYSRPNWRAVASDLAQTGVDEQQLVAELASFADKMSELPRMMKQAGVAQEIIMARTPLIHALVESV